MDILDQSSLNYIQFGVIHFACLAPTPPCNLGKLTSQSSRSANFFHEYLVDTPFMNPLIRFEMN